MDTETGTHTDIHTAWSTKLSDNHLNQMLQKKEKLTEEDQYIIERLAAPKFPV